MHTLQDCKVGDWLKMLVKTKGNDALDMEQEYDVGTTARVVRIDTYPAPQGLSVSVAIGMDEEPDNRIVNVFDESDGKGPFFELITRDNENNEYTAARYDAESAEIAVEQILLSYAKGEHNGGRVEWEDLNIAFEYALVAMPGRYEDILKELQESDIEWNSGS